MIRPDYEKLLPGKWTPEEVEHHLTYTFDLVCREWVDLMEPYVVMLADAEPGDRVAIMRRGLRETVRVRFG